MGFTFSLKMVGTKILVRTKILVPRSWSQDLWGNRSLHDGGTALSLARNRYPFFTVRTPQASLVGEKYPKQNLQWAVLTGFHFRCKNS